MSYFTFPATLRPFRRIFPITAVLLPLCISVLSTEVQAEPETSNKILCLHGGGGSASGFRGAVSDLQNALPEFEFVFVNGGYPISGGQYLWIEDPPGGKEEPTTDPYFADVSITALNNIVEEQGPFYGILGYSQGAAFVPVYLSRVETGTFQLAITFCGYLTSTHLGILGMVNDESPFGDIPALVWMGGRDGIITNDMTREMASKFTEPTIVVNSRAGHIVPQSNDETFDQVTAFVRGEPFEGDNDNNDNIFQNDKEDWDNDKDWGNDKEDWDNDKEDWGNDKEDWDNDKDWGNDKEDWDNDKDWGNDKEDWDNDKDLENDKEDWGNDKEDWGNDKEDWDNDKDMGNDKEDWDNDMDEENDSANNENISGQFTEVLRQLLSLINILLDQILNALGQR